MLRTRLAQAYIKRTIRPLYGWTQATPKSVFLDPDWDRSVDIYPGFGFVKLSGDLVTLPNAESDIPYGLGALYVGGDGIDEVLDSGINAFAVWVLAPDAEFEVLAPAFGTIAAEQSTGVEQLLYVVHTGADRGKLTTTSDGNSTDAPVARLLKVNSATKITIGGLR